MHGMHASRIARHVRHARLLVNVQRVEVGAKSERGIRTAVAQHADYAGPREPRMYFDTERLQLLGDERGGRLFFERGLGMRVQMMAPRAHFGVQRRDFGDEIHGVDPGMGTPILPDRARCGHAKKKRARRPASRTTLR